MGISTIFLIADLGSWGCRVNFIFVLLE